MQTSLDGPLLRRAQICSSHGALCKGDIPASPFPSELPQLHQRRISRAWRGGKKKRKEKKEEGERESSVFLIISPWGFSCGGEGEVNNFVYRVCVALLFHFVASFVSSFFFFLLRNRGMINADPLPIYSPLSPLSLLFWEDSPLVINSQQN